MRIDDINTRILVQRYTKAQKTRAPESPEGPQESSDAVALSPEAQGFADALRAARDHDPVDKAKVEDVSRRMAQGSYHVSANDVADSILKK